jgi:hypothetical protein
MSWLTGSRLFIEIWPLIRSNIRDPEERIEFTARLLRLFCDEDMDPWDVEDVHPEIRAAMRQAGIQIAEPERYPDDAQALAESDSSGHQRTPTSLLSKTLARLRHRLWP